jgi:hypothetical protein
MNSNLPGHSRGSLMKGADTVLLAEIDGTPPLDMRRPERVSLYTDGATPNTAWGNVRLGTTSHVLNPPRHDPAVMFLGCDGHVKLLRPETVSSGRDNPSAIGAQDSVHAAGTKALGSSYTLTFSER